MQVFRRSVSVAYRTSVPRRQGWHNLSAYVNSAEDAKAWRELRNRDLAVQSSVDRYGKLSKTSEVQWPYWEEAIGHQNILKCLKDFYDHQVGLIESVLKVDHEKFVKLQTEGWELFEDAVKSCEKSVEKSEALVANGARALWVSYNNPPARAIDTNEWVESDLYWQAYIEKHHFYNPNPTANDPELPSEIEATKKSWHTRVGAFNDRSEIPVLHSYMAQYPSWEYYDIHRRAFLEHICYYLIRTGGDYRFFPEVPPWQWLIDIESLRYRFISVTQRRRVHFQLLYEERGRSLDVQPLDYEHDGEAYHQKFLQSEFRMYEFMVGRLMGNFMFLTHPFIPIQSMMALKRAVAVDGGAGVFYSIGEDVNALFYLPGMEGVIPSPREGLTAVMDHFAMTGKRFNPGYATLLDIHVDLLEKRSASSWFSIPGESVADGFMRRLRRDDAAYGVYESYVKELKERFERATIVPSIHVMERVEQIQSVQRQEDFVYQLVVYAMDPELFAESQSQQERFVQLDTANQLQPLMDSGSFVIYDHWSNSYVYDRDVVARALSEIEETQATLLEYVKSVKGLG